MIKTICFDLGGDKELYLTIDEIIKLQQAFRFVCVDKYAEPAKPVEPFGDEYARAIKFREERGLDNPPPISNPFPHPNFSGVKFVHGPSCSDEEVARRIAAAQAPGNGQR